MALKKAVGSHVQEDELEEYILGRLDLEARAWITLHLDACETCSDAYFECSRDINDLKAVLELAQLIKPLPAWQPVGRKRARLELVMSPFVVS